MRLLANLLFGSRAPSQIGQSIAGAICLNKMEHLGVVLLSWAPSLIFRLIADAISLNKMEYLEPFLFISVSSLNFKKAIPTGNLNKTFAALAFFVYFNSYRGAKMSINRDRDKQERLVFIVFVYREGADTLKMSESGAAEQNPAAKWGRRSGLLPEREIRPRDRVMRSGSVASAVNCQIIINFYGFLSIFVDFCRDLSKFVELFRYHSGHLNWYNLHCTSGTPVPFRWR